MTALGKARVGLVGARGYVGQELVRIVARHPRLEIAFAASTSRVGEPVAAHLEGAPEGLAFIDVSGVGEAAKNAEVVVLGVSNGEATGAAAAVALANPDAIILDLSADHRFDDAWVWGVPELRRKALAGAKRVANPGCYATALALGLAPVAPLLAGPAHAFGLSGWSGAGATPSPRNDVELLRDNVMPYALTDHTHEREVSRHVAPVHFVPHVAGFARGVVVTLSMTFARPTTAEELRARYVEAYGDEPLIALGDEPPLVRSIVGKPGALIGGFAVAANGDRGVVVSAVDNLLKGAASQAVQNINLALGLPELTGIEPWPA